MAKEKVLVVDDDPDTLQHTRESLVEADFEVVTAVDGGAARQIASDEQPDVVVLAAEMATVGGREVLKEFKGDASLRHIPVIMIAEAPPVDEVVAGLEQGAHDFVSRPCSGRELAARVSAAVRIKLAADRLRARNARLESLAKHVQAAVQHFEQPRRKVPGAEDGGERKEVVKLTRRELEILQLLAQGLSNDVISRQLFISPTTTRNHIQNILGKLGVHSKLEAVAYAVRAGYVDFIG